MRSLRVSRIGLWLTSSWARKPAAASMANLPFWSSFVCISAKASGSVGLRPSGSKPTSPG